MQEKSLADFVKEAAVSPTAEDLLRDLRGEQPGASHDQPETVLVILETA